MSTDAWDPVVAAVREIGAAFSVNTSRDLAEVTTPFVGPDKTRIELSVERTESGYRVSDGGYVADFFFMQGRELSQDETLTEDVIAIAERMGVELSGETLVAEGSDMSIRGLMIAIMQTTLSIPDLWKEGREPVPRRSFRDSLKNEVSRLRLPVTEDIRITGKVEEHSFDLGRQSDGEMVGVQTLSATTHARALEVKRMIAWDIVDVRDANISLQPVVVIDDSTKRRRRALENGVIPPLERLSANVFSWSELRDEDFLKLQRALQVL